MMLYSIKRVERRRGDDARVVSQPSFEESKKLPKHDGIAHGGKRGLFAPLHGGIVYCWYFGDYDNHVLGEASPKSKIAHRWNPWANYCGQDISSNPRDHGCQDVNR